MDALKPQVYYLQFYQAKDGTTYHGQIETNKRRLTWLERRNVTQGFPEDRPAFLLKVRLKELEIQ